MLLRRQAAAQSRALGAPFGTLSEAATRFVRKAGAFIVRDCRVEASYRLDFALRALNTLVPLLFFYFLSELVPEEGAPGLGKYGGDYFAFVLVGIAFHRYLQLSMRMFADSIRLAQVTGSLEAMLGTQTRPVTLVLFSSLYGLISTTAHLLLIFAAAKIAFGFSFARADCAAALVVFFLSVLTFIGLGVLAATAIILFKRGDPVTWLFTNLGVVLGGAYFPLEVMPGWLQKIAWLNPLTHSLDAFRMTLLQGRSLAEVARPMCFLACFGALVFPASLWLFAWSVRRGRKDGTLAQY